MDELRLMGFTQYASHKPAERVFLVLAEGRDSQLFDAISMAAGARIQRIKVCFKFGDQSSGVSRVRAFGSYEGWHRSTAFSPGVDELSSEPTSSLYPKVGASRALSGPATAAAAPASS